MEVAAQIATFTTATGQAQQNAALHHGIKTKNKQTVHRARNKQLKDEQELYPAKFKLLGKYVRDLQIANPTSTFKLKTNNLGQFESLTAVCGSLGNCPPDLFRSVFGTDGTHAKHRVWQGVLLISVIQFGNGQTMPYAITWLGGNERGAGYTDLVTAMESTSGWMPFLNRAPQEGVATICHWSDWLKGELCAARHAPPKTTIQPLPPHTNTTTANTTTNATANTTSKSPNHQVPIYSDHALCTLSHAHRHSFHFCDRDWQDARRARQRAPVSVRPPHHREHPVSLSSSSAWLPRRHDLARHQGQGQDRVLHRPG